MRAIEFLASVAILFLLWKLADVILIIFAGVLLAIFFHKLGHLIADRTYFGAKVSLSLVLVVLLLCTAAASLTIAPRLATQVDRITEQVGPAISQVLESLSRYAWGKHLLAALNPGALIGSGLDVLGSGASYIGWAIVGTFIIVAIGMYIGADAPRYVEGTLRLFPKRHRRVARKIMDEAGSRLWRWMLGRLVSMVAIATLTGVGLMALGIPLAWTLAIIAGLLAIIPNVGPTASAILAALVALPLGWQRVLWVIGLFLVVQFVESYLLTPHVENRSASIPPALVLAAQLAMGVLFGFIGLLVASPLVVVAMVTIEKTSIEA